MVIDITHDGSSFQVDRLVILVQDHEGEVSTHLVSGPAGAMATGGPGEGVAYAAGVEDDLANATWEDAEWQ